MDKPPELADPKDVMRVIVDALRSQFLLDIDSELVTYRSVSRSMYYFEIEHNQRVGDIALRLPAVEYKVQLAIADMYRQLRDRDTPKR